MNYYNEFDPRAAAWLRELMAQKLIPEGKIDERDIRLVTGRDLDGFAQCHFFAGIGGWPLALALAGWPQDEPVWTGSCPCQPFSVAGKKKGKRDPRHLWPEFKRLIAECRPAIVFGEQVASKAGRLWLNGVFADLETLAYAVAGADLCAAGINAPHIRQRLWWVANAMRSGRSTRRAQSRNGQIAGSGVAGRLADRASVRSAEHGSQPRERETTGPHNTAERNGAGRLAVTAGKQVDAANAKGFHAEPGSGGIDGRLADDAGERRQRRADTAESSRRSLAQNGGSIDGMGDTISGGTAARLSESTQREERVAGKPLDASGPCDSRSAARAWGDFDIIPCRDGKARRIESGTFPLADGFPGRVGLLRGYGNAIVPELAAEFIQACIEALMHP